MICYGFYEMIMFFIGLCLVYRIVLCCVALYCNVMCCTILSCSDTVCHTILYYFVLCYMALNPKLILKVLAYSRAFRTAHCSASQFEACRNTSPLDWQPLGYSVSFHLVVSPTLR